MASPQNTWQDRRGMFQKGKEVHEPGRPLTTTTSGTSGSGAVSDAIRRASVSSSDGLERTTSNTSTGSPTSGQRRSSTSGNMFANLTNHKRGSEDYGERRASHSDQSAASGGVFSKWYQSTFRGMTGNSAVAEEAAPKEANKGVME